MRKFVEWTYEAAWTQCRAVGTVVHPHPALDEMFGATHAGRPPPQQGPWPAGSEELSVGTDDTMLPEAIIPAGYDLAQAQWYAQLLGVEPDVLARVNVEQTTGNGAFRPSAPNPFDGRRSRFEPYGRQPPVGAPRGEAAGGQRDELFFGSAGEEEAGEFEDAAPNTPIGGPVPAPASPIDIAVRG